MTTREAVVVIDAAREADLAGVAAMEQSSFSDPWSASSFTSLLSEPAVYFSVARNPASGAVVGYIIAWFAADEGEIANVAVDRAYRQRGIGAALLDATLDEATRRGAVAVYLDVREGNVAAQALYASRGFEAVGRRRRYYRRPVEDAVVLRRAIGRS